MHPPEAASGTLQISRRLGRAATRASGDLTVVVAAAADDDDDDDDVGGGDDDEVDHDVDPSGHTRTCRGPARLRARTHAGWTWHETSPPVVVCGARAYRMDDNWIEGRRREEVRMRRSELREGGGRKRSREEEEEEWGSPLPPPQAFLVSQS